MLLEPNLAADVFSDPSAFEQIGDGSAMVAVDLRSTGLDPATLDRLESGLAIAPPWVTVAVVAESAAADDRLAGLAERFDVVLAAAEHANAFGGVVVTVDSVEAATQQLADAIAASRDASVALVQLLRSGPMLSTELALHAESVTYAALQTGDRYQSFLSGRDQRVRPQSEGHDRVRLERDGSLLRLTLTRPDRRNALDVAMRDELAEAFRLLDADDSIDGAIWSGIGPNFCAGGDLDEFGTTPSAAIGHHVRSIRSLPRLIERVRSRLRVRVHGACVGAGIELPAFAHSVIADPASTFRLPEVGFGLVPGAGGTVSVPRRVGRHRAAWLALTGTALDAQTALAWGLVDRIAPVDPQSDA